MFNSKVSFLSMDTDSLIKDEKSNVMFTLESTDVSRCGFNSKVKVLLSSGSTLNFPSHSTSP